MRDGWVNTTLGDVARVTSGFAFSTKSWRETGIPVIKINNVRNGHVSLANCSFVSDPLPDGASRFLLKKGDLLITLTGEIGAVGFVTQSQPMYLNQRVGRIDLHDNKNVLLDFLGLFLTLPEIRAEMWSHGKGNAQLNISPTSIHSLKINLPPLPEQKRIVDLISSVDSYSEALQRQLESAKKSRNAVLHELLTAGGVDWTRAGLSEICIMIKRGQAPSYTEQRSVKVLNQKCIRNGQLQFEFARQTDSTVKPINEWAFLRAEDTLVNSTGVGTLGRVAFVGTRDEPLTVDSHITIVRPDKNKIQPSFLGLSLHFREADIEGLAAGSSGQTELSREALGNLIITIPPVSEQKRIVEIISSIDEVIEQNRIAIAEAQNLRSGLLSDLLSGEHEIPTTYDKVIGAA
jgi:type I restriction enzyme S subunit